MLERISVISRNEIDSAYKDHIFFKIIRILCQPYVVSLKCFHLMPEEVFQEVMAWLDFISRTEADEDVLVVYSSVRSRIWGDMRLLAVTQCPDEEIDKSADLVMGILFTCLMKLSDDFVDGYGFYKTLAFSLFEQMTRETKDRDHVISSIISNSYYEAHNEELNDWLIEYMLYSDNTLTDHEGRLKTTLARNGNPKGRKPSLLFTNADKKKDVEATEYWAHVFKKYISSRQRKGLMLDTKQDNFLILSIHAFKQYWCDDKKMKLPSAGSAFCKFLMEDCLFELGEDELGNKIKLSSVNDTLTKVLSKKLNEYDGDYLAVNRFMQRFLESPF